jgi:hypothetical protein
MHAFGDIFYIQLVSSFNYIMKCCLSSKLQELSTFFKRLDVSQIEVNIYQVLSNERM